jgi:hypothetical protein
MRIKGLTLKEFAIQISDYLMTHDIDVVLSGGACVSIHTNYKYLSYDLDFVLISSDKQKKVKDLLIYQGFFAEGRYFKHRDTEFYLDFVPPPLSVGNEPVREIFVIKKGNRRLKLLSPTDCVKDRLAAFYHWNDRQTLHQAVLVCKNCAVDLEEIERWSKNEGMFTKYKKFLAALRA